MPQDARCSGGTQGQDGFETNLGRRGDLRYFSCGAPPFIAVRVFGPNQLHSNEQHAQALVIMAQDLPFASASAGVEPVGGFLQQPGLSLIRGRGARDDADARRHGGKQSAVVQVTEQTRD